MQKLAKKSCKNLIRSQQMKTNESKLTNKQKANKIMEAVNNQQQEQ